MSTHFISTLKSTFLEFSPLIFFYLGNYCFGFKVAIGLTLAISILQYSYLKLKKQTISNFFKFSFLISILFGLLDLSLKNPIFFRYEASMTNVITGIFFGLTLFNGKPMIQEFGEKRLEAKGELHKITPLTIYFFKISTIVWTFYFFLKAIVYAYISSRYSINEGLAIRTVVGNVSFYTLLFVNIFCAKTMIGWIKRIKKF